MRRQLRGTFEYVMAGAVTMATLWVRLQLGPIPDRPITIMFVIPILLSATLGGLGPGLFATALSAALTAYYIIPPRYSFEFTNTLDLVQWSIMVSCGILVSLLNHALRRSVCEATEARLRANQLEREKAAEAALRQSEERLRLAIASTRALVYDNDWLSGKNISSEGLEELLGYRHDEVDPTPAWWFEQIHPADGLTSEAAREIVARQDAFCVEYRIRHKAGHYLDVVDSGRVIRDAEGRVARIVGCVMNVTARKAAERALRERDERLRMHIENSPLGAVEWDRDFRVVHWSEGAERLFGWSEREVMGKHPAEFGFVHEGDREAVDRMIEQLTGGLVRRTTSANRNVCKDGRVAHCEWQNSALLDERGEMVSIMSLAKDVTARVEAETTLKRFRRALDSAVDNIFLIDPARMRFVDVNQNACEALGFSREELLELGPPDIKPRMSREELHALFTGLIERQEDGKIETVHRRKDGGELEVEVLLKPMFLEGETLVVAVARDISERKRAEAALQNTTALLRAISETTPDPVFAKDRAGRLLLANPATLRAIGKPAEAVLGKNEIEWLDDPEQAAAIMANDRRVMESGEPMEVEERLTTPEGLRVFWGVKSPMRDAAGRVIGLVGIIRDITERKQAEEALRGANDALAEADKRKDEFLAMLAHELRNPLAPVRNAIQIMQAFCAGSCSNAERMNRQRQIIDRQVTHMARLLDDLLDVSRVTRGKITLKMQPLALADLLPHAADIVQPQIEARRHELLLSPVPADLRVEADWDRLIQIVGNLLTNAAKYTDPGGRIWLEAFREGGQAVIRVRDSGMGIAPEMLGRVFELFAQAEGGLARSQGGLGIGLTMVKSLVQLHGGTIEVRSEGLGQGSEFTIFLPVLAETARATAPRARPQAPMSEGPPRRVLVVDDLADSAASMAELLSLWGHEVRTAYDGDQALEIAHAFKPEIMLLDIGLPGMDGYEVARRLRFQDGYGKPWLVALTGYGAEDDRQRALEAGFDHHLVKPVDLAVLRELIAQFVELQV